MLFPLSKRVTNLQRNGYDAVHLDRLPVSEFVPLNSATPFDDWSIKAMTKLLINKLTNRIQSLLLILAMTVILSVCGYLLFGFWGWIIAMGLAIGSCMYGPQISTRWVMRMYKARQIHPADAPELFQTFRALVQTAELEHTPALYYIPTRMPNAFATGKDENAAVALTDGLLRMMTPREISGILAHEVAHLMHRDTTVMALADTISRLISTLSRVGLLMMLFSVPVYFAMGNGWNWLLCGAFLFVAPTITVLLQLALSRSREFNADLGAVQLTRDSRGLASALEKLERLTKSGGFLRRVLTPGQRRAQPALLRTHPPTQERIERLLEHSPDQKSDGTMESPFNLSNGISDVQSNPNPTQRRQRVRVIRIPRVRRVPRYHFRNGSWH